ncbi:MAG: hypothetical protein ACREI9_09315 [Nitrospiraceae bacterium]
MTKVRGVLEWTPSESKLYLERMAERRSVDRALLAFMGVTPPTVEEPKRRDGKVGGFCGGTCVQACQTLFGIDGLAMACRTCPD